MTWAPGLPVLTEQDKREWQAWRRDRKRAAQRERRARYMRIDFYPDDIAVQVIESLVKPRAGHDYSSVINRIVGEWGAEHGELPPEFTNHG